MAGRLMELLGNLGTAVHAGIVATEALENELKDAEGRVKTLNAKNEEVKGLETDIGELSKQKAVLEQTVKNLKAERTAILAKYQE